MAESGRIIYTKSDVIAALEEEGLVLTSGSAAIDAAIVGIATALITSSGTIGVALGITVGALQDALVGKKNLFKNALVEMSKDDNVVLVCTMTQNTQSEYPKVFIKYSYEVQE